MGAWTSNIIEIIYTYTSRNAAHVLLFILWLFLQRNKHAEAFRNKVKTLLSISVHFHNVCNYIEVYNNQLTEWWSQEAVLILLLCKTAVVGRGLRLGVATQHYTSLNYAFRPSSLSFTFLLMIFLLFFPSSAVSAQWKCPIVREDPV